jgi:hypothetical protein
VGFVLCVLMFALGWWTFRKVDRTLGLSDSFPRAVRWLTSGFGVYRAFQGIIRLFETAAQYSQRWFEEGIWKGAPTLRFARALRAIATGVSSADEDLVEIPVRGIRKSIDVPAKIFQLLQSGDLQWYLFVSLTMGFALMAHFMPKGR